MEPPQRRHSQPARTVSVVPRESTPHEHPRVTEPGTPLPTQWCGDNSSSPPLLPALAREHSSECGRKCMRTNSKEPGEGIIAQRFCLGLLHLGTALFLYTLSIQRVVVICSLRKRAMIVNGISHSLERRLTDRTLEAVTVPHFANRFCGSCVHNSGTHKHTL